MFGHGQLLSQMLAVLGLGIWIGMGGCIVKNGDPTDDDDTTDDDTTDDDDEGGDDDDDDSDDDDDDGSDDDSGSEDASFGADILPLINGCTCHLGAQPSSGLGLQADSAHGNLVNVPSNQYPALDQVEPGTPDDSYFLLKVRDSYPPVGSQMPSMGPTLSPEEVDLIVDWITQGALDN